MKPLRIAVIGRTEMLLLAARRAACEGHDIAFVATAGPSSHETVDINDFRSLAARHEAPFVRGSDLLTEDTLSQLSGLNLDIAISMNWTTLLPDAVRNLFRFGVINAHPGDLPRYKGNACPNWAILAGEEQVVLTFHQMDASLDSGPVAAKHRFALKPDTYIQEVYQWLEKEVPAGFCDLLTLAASDMLELKPQDPDPAQGLRCFPRRPSDARINWSAPAEHICRLVRASSRPFAGAFCFYEDGTRLTIWKARVMTATEPFLAVPGQVAFVDRGMPVIACGKDYIQIEDIKHDDTGEDARALVLGSMRGRLE